MALRGRFELYLSPFILEEVGAVLTRKFDWEEDRSLEAVRVLRDAATIVEPERLTEVIEQGHADNLVLDCVAAAAAEYLVTGDRRHLLPLVEHRGARILNAPRFLSSLEAWPPGR